MRKLRFLFLSLFVMVSASAFVACNDEDDGVNSILVENTLPALTKVTITDQQQFLWQENDAMSVWYFADNTTVLNNDSFTLRQSDAGRITGGFTGGVSDWTGDAAKHTFYTVYPYNSLYRVEHGTGATIVVPEKQEYAATIQDFSKQILWAGKNTYSSVQDKASITSTSPVGILQIELNASGTPLNNVKLKSAELKSNKPISGSASYDFDLRKVEGFKSTVVSFDAEDVVLTTNNLFFMIYPQDLATHNFTLTLTGEDMEAVFDLSGMINFRLDAQSIGTYELKVQDAIAGGRVDFNYVASDAAKEANCYIVAPNSSVTIPVSRAYKAWRTRDELSDAPLTQRSGVPSVDILWIDNNLGITNAGSISSCYYVESTAAVEKATIVVKTGATEGNAVLAFSIGEEIVWSWHIWVTDYDPDATAGDFSGIYLMDRNIGALSGEYGNNDAYGMHYQWGRKDPFVPVADGYNPEESGQRRIFDKNGEQKYYSFNNVPPYLDEETGIKYAINYPDRYILNPNDMQVGGSALWTSNAFIEPDNMINDLWYDEVTGVKTVYDPCPYGWRTIAEDTIFSGITSTGFEPGEGMDLNGIYFPAQGYYDIFAWRIVEVGNFVSFWCAKPGGFGGRVFEGMMGGEILTPNKNSSFRAFGNPVRCAKDQ